LRCFTDHQSTGNRDRSVKRLFDIDSFLQPLVDDLRILAVDGVPAQRWIHDESSGTEIMRDFTLKAHLLTFTGDMPAVAKVSQRRRSKVQVLNACCTSDYALSGDKC
jgi:hypothetical protein